MRNGTATFDTHEFIETLTSSGLPPEHARAIADGLKRISLRHVATKADVALVREEIRHLATKAELHAELSQMQAGLIKWFTGLLLAQGGSSRRL